MHEVIDKPKIETTEEPKAIAFVPARAGSKRVKNKNIFELNGKPLIAHTIEPAIKSKCFDKVVLVTDSNEYADLGKMYGAEVPVLRPKKTATDNSPDIDWLKWMLNYFQKQGLDFDIFCILRPTSPFRNPETIHRAFKKFLTHQYCDSLRAVQKVSEHPGKMWTLSGDQMFPLIPFSQGNTPFHSSPYDALPEIYIQNASLEIGWTTIVKTSGTISGSTIVPFFTEGIEGFDINSPEDLILAEHYAKAFSHQP